MARLEETDGSMRAALDNADKLKAELYAVKMELERQRARYKDDHTMLTSENEELLQKVEELKNEVVSSRMIVSCNCPKK